MQFYLGKSILIYMIWYVNAIFFCIFEVNKTIKRYQILHGCFANKINKLILSLKDQNINFIPAWLIIPSKAL